MKSHQVIVISGATGGIGRGISEALYKQGYSLALLGRSLHKLEELHSVLDKSSNINIYPVDICSLSDVSTTIDCIMNDFGKIDHLVQAAGDGPLSSALDFNEDNWQQTINTKLLGTARLVSLVSKKMNDADVDYSMTIINGVFSREPSSLFTINSAVNSAVSGYAKAAATELAHSSIRLNVVNPGATDTPLWNEIANSASKKIGISTNDFNQNVLDSIPLKRFNKPSDIAHVVEFLISYMSRNITGTEITIDGGACHSL